MKSKNLKQIIALFSLATLISWTACCQGSDTSKSTIYTIAYTSKETGKVEIYSFNSEGKSTKKSTHENGGYAAWSPDGKHIAFYSKYDDKKTWSIHTMTSNGKNRKRLTDVKNKWDNSPTWSPDGNKIAFARAYRNAANVWQYEIWIMNSDGTDQKQIIGLEGGGPYFTSDGRILFHSQPNPSEIFIANIDGSNLIQLTNNKTEDWHPEVSPDNTQIAFMSNRGEGVHQIYTMNIDGSNQKRLTSQDFDCWYPSWSPDGSQLIFVSGDPKKGRQIYIMNKNGSEIRKIINGGSQAAWLKTTKQ